jgi:hypothetical protein
MGLPKTKDFSLLFARYPGKCVFWKNQFCPKMVWQTLEILFGQKEQKNY